MTDASGFVLARDFNGHAELDGAVYGLGLGDVFSWNVEERYADGRIKRKTETAGAVSTTFAYTYDPNGGLRTVTADGALVEDYTYDPAGTRETETNVHRNIAGRIYSYSDEDHLLTAGTVQYAHDLDGFLTTKTDGAEVTAYDYASRGELLRVDLPDGRVIEYVHDPLGRRIAKKIDGTTVEKYLWFGRTTLLAVFDGADNLLMRFEYADGRMPVVMTKGGVRYYLACDQVGTLRVVTDSTGAVVKQIDYDTFGNVVADTNPVFAVPFGFAGGLHDRDTGLVRFGYRDYDPETGRWTAKNPILFAGGDVDLYGYCLWDPVNAVDPYGKFALTAPAIIAHGIFAVATAYYGAKAINETKIALESRGGRNRIPDQGEPGTVGVNSPGTTKKKYGPDGWVEKEWNKGHGSNWKNPDERDDHIHDHLPNPFHPKGRPIRQDGRRPKPGEEDEFCQ
jgi:RHS repeat-associated protein